MDNKSCPKCGHIKVLSDFYRDKRTPTGVASWCKECVKANQKARYQDPELRQRKLDGNRTRRYDITPEQYGAKMIAQDGKCAICGETCPTGNSLAVDHNHETMQVRGLLCVNCNQAIGKFGDSVMKLQRAIEYLREYE